MKYDQIKLLNALAKEIKIEVKEPATIQKTFQAAKILTKQGKFTSHFSQLRKLQAK